MNPIIQHIACSGPGAGESIARNVSIGYASAGLTALLVIRMVLFSLRHGLPRWPVAASAVLLLLHPAWTISATKGDCGYMKRYASYGVLAVVLAFSGATRWMARRNESREDYSRHV